MIQQLIDQHLSAITAQIRAKYPSEMESYAKRLINLGMDADQVEEDMQAVLRTLVMRNESVSDEEDVYKRQVFMGLEIKGSGFRQAWRKASGSFRLSAVRRL